MKKCPAHMSGHLWIPFASQARLDPDRRRTIAAGPSESKTSSSIESGAIQTIYRRIWRHVHLQHCFIREVVDMRV